MAEVDMTDAPPAAASAQDKGKKIVTGPDNTANGKKRFEVKKV